MKKTILAMLVCLSLFTISQVEAKMIQVPKGGFKPEVYPLKKQTLKGFCGKNLSEKIINDFFDKIKPHENPQWFTYAVPRKAELCFVHALKSAGYVAHSKGYVSRKTGRIEIEFYQYNHDW